MTTEIALLGGLLISILVGAGYALYLAEQTLQLVLRVLKEAIITEDLGEALRLLDELPRRLQKPVAAIIWAFYQADPDLSTAWLEAALADRGCLPGKAAIKK